MTKEEAVQFYNSMIAKYEDDPVTSIYYGIKKNRLLHGADWYKNYNIFPEVQR